MDQELISISTIQKFPAQDAPGSPSHIPRFRFINIINIISFYILQLRKTFSAVVFKESFMIYILNSKKIWQFKKKTIFCLYGVHKFCDSKYHKLFTPVTLKEKETKHIL